MAKPLCAMNDGEVAQELVHVASIVAKGPVGTHYWSQTRVAALLRSAARRLEKRPKLRSETLPELLDRA